MSYSIVPTTNFEKELKTLSKKYHSLKSDLANLSKLLLEEPIQGVEILKNCYKIDLQLRVKEKVKAVADV